MPSYMHKDMRKKGAVEFELKVRSQIKQFCIDTKRVDANSLKDLEDFYDKQKKIIEGENAQPPKQEPETTKNQECQTNDQNQPNAQLP